MARGDVFDGIVAELDDIAPCNKDVTVRVLEKYPIFPQTSQSPEVNATDEITITEFVVIPIADATGNVDDEYSPTLPADALSFVEVAGV